MHERNSPLGSEGKRAKFFTKLEAESRFKIAIRAKCSKMYLVDRCKAEEGLVPDLLGMDLYGPLHHGVLPHQQHDRVPTETLSDVLQLVRSDTVGGNGRGSGTASRRQHDVDRAKKDRSNRTGLIEKERRKIAEYQREERTLITSACSYRNASRRFLH